MAAVREQAAKFQNLLETCGQKLFRVSCKLQLLQVEIISLCWTHSALVTLWWSRDCSPYWKKDRLSFKYRKTCQVGQWMRSGCGLEGWTFLKMCPPFKTTFTTKPAAACALRAQRRAVHAPRLPVSRRAWMPCTNAVHYIYSTLGRVFLVRW